jgi:hypothetical protein
MIHSLVPQFHYEYCFLYRIFCGDVPEGILLRNKANPVFVPREMPACNKAPLFTTLALRLDGLKRFFLLTCYLANLDLQRQIRAKDVKRVCGKKYGWLYKAGLNNTKMQKRWCAVHDLKLYYYESPRVRLFPFLLLVKFFLLRTERAP